MQNNINNKDGSLCSFDIDRSKNYSSSNIINDTMKNWVILDGTRRNSSYLLNITLNKTLQKLNQNNSLAREKKKFDLSSNEKRRCKICLEEETKNNPLISPCLCTGSIRYIHNDCLKKWIVEQKTSVFDAKCEICKTAYNIDFIFENILNKHKKSKFIRKEGSLTIMFILFIFGSDWAVNTFLFKQWLKEKDCLHHILLASYGIAFLFCVWILYYVFNRYKIKCYDTVIKSWSIQDFRKPKCTIFHIKENKSQSVYNPMNSSLAPVINNYINNE